MPADDSPFVNQIFDPENVDLFFEGTDLGRQKLRRVHAATNYSAVDIDLVESLYAKWYNEQVTGQDRLKILQANQLKIS